MALSELLISRIKFLIALTASSEEWIDQISFLKAANEFNICTTELKKQTVFLNSANLLEYCLLPGNSYGNSYPNSFT